MKFYCTFCGSVLELTGITILTLNQRDLEQGNKWDGETVHCDICSSENQEVWMKYFPDHETPEQYRARTGRRWPEDGPVWILRDDEKEFLGGGFWGVCRYKTAKDMGDRIIICVQGPNPPPKGWRP
jgi:hypothetical protein